MADIDLLPGIILEVKLRDDPHITLQAETELDEASVTQHNYNEMASATLPYSSASPNLPSRILNSAKPIISEIPPPAKASDAWNTIQSVPQMKQEICSDLNSFTHDVSSRPTKSKHEIKGEVLIPPMPEDNHLHQQMSNTVEHTRQRGYQPSHPTEKLRRRHPNSNASRKINHAHHSLAQPPENTVLHNQFSMPHTVDAHGGERNNGVSTSVSCDGQNQSANTFSTGETSVKSTVTEESDKTTLREVWTKMFGAGNYSSLPKLMSQSNHFKTQDAIKHSPSIHGSHSCDELDTHPHDVSNHSTQVNKNRYSVDLSYLNDKPPNANLLKENDLPQNDTVHSNDDFEQHCNILNHASGLGGNVTDTHYRESIDKRDNKVHISQIKKLKTKSIHTALSPDEIQRLKYCTGLSPVQNTTQSPLDATEANPTKRVNEHVSKESQSDIFTEGALTEENAIQSQAGDNLEKSTSIPSTQSDIVPNSAKHPVHAPPTNPMNNDFISYPNTTLNERIIRSVSNDSSLKDSNAPVKDTVGIAYLKADNGSEQSKYHITNSSSPTRKLKTRRRVSLESGADFGSSICSDMQMHETISEVPRCTSNQEIKGKSLQKSKTSDRDTSDSVSVNSGVVGLKRGRLSSRGRNGSFAATKYDKMKGPTSQSFAGFPQHARQYSSTSDDQSMNQGDSRENSFNKRQPMHTINSFDEPSGRKFKIGYAKAKALKQRYSNRRLKNEELDDSIDTSEQDMSLLKEKVTSLEANIVNMEERLKAANRCKGRWNETISSTDSGSKIYSGVKKLRKTSNHNREIEHVKRRFQRLESHVVTLARSLAQLSSEMKSHHASLEELESVTQGLQPVQEEKPQDQSGGEKQWMTSLRSNSNSLNKLRRFFGDEPPMLQCFLENLGYENYLNMFENECISVIELPYINERRLENLGIPLGPRLRIIQEARLIFCQ